MPSFSRAIATLPSSEWDGTGVMVGPHGSVTPVPAVMADPEKKTKP